MLPAAVRREGAGATKEKGLPAMESPVCGGEVSPTSPHPLRRRPRHRRNRRKKPLPKPEDVPGAVEDDVIVDVSVLPSVDEKLPISAASCQDEPTYQTGT